MNRTSPPVVLSGIRFDQFDFNSTLKLIVDRPSTEPFAYFVAINADVMLRLDRSGAALRRIFANAWLALNDSRVLRILAALRGYSLTVVPGSDLTQALLEYASHHDAPVTIVGGLDATIAALRTRYQLTQLAHHNPPMGFITNEAAVNEAVAFVIAHPARFVFFCVGCPQQEILIDRVAQTGRAHGVGLAVGASIEFAAGTKARAPRWMQTANLEWLYRLLTEPKRLWRRYLLGAMPLLRLVLRLPRNTALSTPKG